MLLYYDAGNAVTTGINNTLVGALTGDALTTGSKNTAMGVGALGSEDTGSRNTALGYGALGLLNYDGDGYNTAVGYEAGAS